jgi:hypothetical protein
MTSPDLDIYIEELVLHGFDGPLVSPGQAIDRARLSAAVQSELARLFAERGIPRSLSRGGQVTSLDGGALDIAPGSGAEAIGGQIAHALYRGLGQ